MVIEKLSEEPTHKQLKSEMQKLVELFSKFSQPPHKTLQGLWAELLVIEQAKDPEYLIQSWHSSPQSKFDFNDGKDKIEVKSTSKSSRIHNFSSEQLNPNIHSNLWIASVFVVETGQGKTIFDLIDNICKKLKNIDLQIKLKEIVANTLGDNLENAFDTYFDYQQGIDTLAFYDFKDVPSIEIKTIPKGVNNVRFDADLSYCNTVKEKQIDFSESSLFKSLKI